MLAELEVHSQRTMLGRARERIARSIANAMPRWLVKWCFIRLVTEVTAPPAYSGAVNDDLGVVAALGRWDGRQR